MWSGSILLTCLLAFVGNAQAARSWQQRRAEANPYIILPPGIGQDVGNGKAPVGFGEKEFTLRHIYHHGSHEYPELHRYIDVPKDAKLQISTDYGATFEAAPQKLEASAASLQIERLRKRKQSDIDNLLEHAYIHGVPADFPSSAWTTDHVAGPNITDKKTIITFAKMALNAYYTSPEDSEWRDVKGGFNYTEDFGWQQDGLRGHIFADEKNATVVIGLKGTSPAIFDGADTTGNDKLNDNLFGSCCCGQGGQILWKQVCDCMTGTYSCNNTCLVKSLRQKSHYYWAVRDLYHNVTERYPNSDVWLSGHSLGGVVSSLLGLTYGLPTLTFEAFPDALAASRLGLPAPPGYKIGAHQSRSSLGIYHFGHTADPIYMGTCNAASSFCTIAGYAFQGVCHTGQTCIYDTVGDLGWRVGIGTHKINNVIRDVLEKYDTVPSCDTDTECQDCFNWKFYESNGTETTTMTTSKSSTATSRTRTETCKTPGFWGCLDESTTTTATITSSSSTSSTSTSTCKTPGWFGCRDPITATATSTNTITTTSAEPGHTTVVVTTTPTTSSKDKTHTSTSTSTSSCKHPGFFGGCRDGDYDPTPTTSSKHKSTHTATTTDECTSRGFFGLICVDPSPTTSSGAEPSATKRPSVGRKVCAARSWLGRCREWRWEDESESRKADLR
ncbi:unnamed protein product [Zymoseptoria tritici ST99CH_1A5]|uniref:triacylglycerol lipase n=1 Tax=Zymoseptoria tritici ST99CH_1A5 TaxID=1276529 RepID=A0A1Y6LEH2_ZYMTR|nr:unnamed protein product [Zymoseptoria tritici ST99CH_1A5]